MSSYDWTKFNLKIDVNAPTDVVYMAWTVPEILERWFLRRAIFRFDKNETGYNTQIHEGQNYEWYWHGYDDNSVEKGEVLIANGINKLQFSFSGGALVTVDIGEVAGKNIVMLTQERIPVNEHGKVNYHMGCKTGWTFYLANLKSYLEGGLDLRNKDIALNGMVNS